MVKALSAVWKEEEEEEEEERRARVSGRGRRILTAPQLSPSRLSVCERGRQERTCHLLLQRREWKRRMRAARPGGSREGREEEQMQEGWW
eukprot:201468-Hanusia_phi.AAC.1